MVGPESLRTRVARLNPEQLIPQLVIYMVVLLLAISAHEAAHAWMSYKFGDDTARCWAESRSIPVAHTDPIGTLLIPIVGFIVWRMGGGNFFLIGWGKPTPVNPLRWRQKDLANVMVSIAGILANLLIATIAFIIFKVLLMNGLGAAMPDGIGEPVILFLRLSADYECFAGGLQSAAVPAAGRKQGAGDFSTGEHATGPGDARAVWLSDPDGLDVHGSSWRDHRPGFVHSCITSLVLLE